MSDLTNKKVKSLPYDENYKGLSGLVAPLVDGLGNITGWSAIASVDNGDGTRALRVSADLVIENADIDIGDIHLLDISNSKINPATKENQQSIITELTDISGAIDDLATEATLSALKLVVDSIESNIDIPLSNLATEVTLSGISSDIDNLNSLFTDGNAKVNAGGVVSTVNSSSIPLGISGVFTGTAEETLGFSHITLQVKSDVASATDGLQVQWSVDSTNWDDSDKFTIPAATGKVFTFGPQARYFRVVYTNNSVAQSYFRLQVIKKTFNQKPSTHRIASMINTDDDAELVKSVIAALKSNGEFTNIGATDDGRLKVDVASIEKSLAELGVMFTASTPLITAASSGTEIPLFLLLNPISSGKTIKIRNIIEGIVSTNKPTIFRIYANPTVTANGTSITARNKLIGNVTASVANAYYGSTVSSFGNLLTSSVVVAGVFVIEQGFSAQFPSNTSLLITVTPTTVNTDTTFSIDWAEQ